MFAQLICHFFVSGADIESMVKGMLSLRNSMEKMTEESELDRFVYVIQFTNQILEVAIFCPIRFKCCVSGYLITRLIFQH